MTQSIEEGYCICYTEPRGQNGLEGYDRDTKYYYEKVINTSTGRKHIRVFQNMFYYETCGPLVFTKFFKKLDGGQWP